MFLGVHDHAGKVGTNGCADAGVRMAFGADAGKHHFARRDVAFFFGNADQRFDDRFAVRIGQGITFLEQSHRDVTDLLIGMRGQSLFLIERKLGKLEFTFFHAFQVSFGPVRLGDQQTERGPAHLRGKCRQLGDNAVPNVRGIARLQRREQSLGQFRPGARIDLLDDCFGRALSVGLWETRSWAALSRSAAVGVFILHLGQE